jgi:hypothetical protein
VSDPRKYGPQLYGVTSPGLLVTVHEQYVPTFDGKKQHECFRVLVTDKSGAVRPSWPSDSLYAAKRKADQVVEAARGIVIAVAKMRKAGKTKIV